MDWLVVVGWAAVIVGCLALWALIAFAAYGVYLLVS